eukprot:1370993-Prymnesium_polylepis.1
MLSKLEEERVSRVATVGWVLFSKVCAGAVSRQQQDAESSGDIVGPAEFTQMRSWHVRQS